MIDVLWAVQVSKLGGRGGMNQHSQYSESWGSHVQGQLSLHSETQSQKTVTIYLVCVMPELPSVDHAFDVDAKTPWPNANPGKSMFLRIF